NMLTKDRSSYTGNLPQYDGNSRDAWVLFKTKLRAAVDDMGSTSSTWRADSFDKVIGKTETFSTATTTLLVGIFNNFLNGSAEVNTRAIRRKTEYPTKFADVYNYLDRLWAAKEKEDYGPVLLAKLRKLQYKPG